MKKKQHGEAQAKSAYLQSAPAPLVALHEGRQSFPGRNILGRLLTDRRMQRPWTVLSRNVSSVSEWERLWKEITLVLRRAREERESRTKEEAQFLKIARQANRLAKSIEDGSLDLLAYELFPVEVMNILGVDNWSSIDRLERAAIAGRLLDEWPSVQELLAELAARAEHLASDAITENRVVERKTRNRETLHFVRALGGYVKARYRTPLYGTVAIIASVVLERDVTKAFVEKELKRGH